MRRDVRFTRWAIVELVAVIVATNTNVVACSGPGAAAVIGRASQIGFLLAGSSLRAVGIVSIYLKSLQVRRNIVLWGLAAIHPGFWESATHGDCGRSLVNDSLLMTLVMGLILSALLALQSSHNDHLRMKRRTIAGALLGAVGGVLFGLVTISASAGCGETFLLASCSFLSFVAAGALGSRWFSTPRDRPWYRPRFRVRSLLVFLVLLAPILAILLPARAYELTESVTTPTTFVIVDEKTAQPVAGARVWLFDIRYSEDNLEMQRPWNVTGDDGCVEDHPLARVTGREGLLGRSEITSFDPLVMRVDAPNYQRFQAPLSGNTRISPKCFSDPPLGLTFPPPLRVVISLKRTRDAD